MQNKLRAAFLAKEKADTFLINLEKLKEEKTIGDAQYRVLKIEYTQLRDDALSQINTIKNAVRKELDEKITKLEIIEQELGYLEARFKVGQLSPSDYMSKSKGPKRTLMDLEKRVSELQTFLDASISAELGGVENARRILGFATASSSRNDIEQKSSSSPASIKESTESKSQPVPLSTTTPPQTPLMPVPIPIPQPIRVTDLQIMPNRVHEGGNLGIVVNVTSITSLYIQHKIDLKVNGSVNDSKDVALMPGEKQELTFVIEAGKPGVYQVEIGGLTGSYTVLATEVIRSL